MTLSIYDPNERLPHQIVLPRLVWSALVSIAVTTKRIQLTRTRFTKDQSHEMSEMINDEWESLRGWFDLAVGIEPDSPDKDAAIGWLYNDGWQQRVRWLQAFFRAGPFHVEEDGDVVELRWTE